MAFVVFTCVASRLTQISQLDAVTNCDRESAIDLLADAVGERRRTLWPWRIGS
jgi:hypothetical protein